MDLINIQEKIGYIFNDERLLSVALTHKSYLSYKRKERAKLEHNERLEFLGDAVLELVVTDYLFRKYYQNEGYMTAIRSSLVNYKLLGQLGNELGLDEEIQLSPGEKAELGKARLTIVADCVEAIIGAIYIDGGYQDAAEFVHRNVIVKIDDIIADQSYKDAKTELQEYTQRELKLTPRYEVLSTEGKDHNKTFFMAVYIGEIKQGEGNGKSKQDAETQCAIIALNNLKL
jgi:ribonuclease III